MHQYFMMTLHNDAFFRFSWALCPTAVMMHTLSAVIKLQRNDSVFPQGSIKLHLALYDLIAAVVTWLVSHIQTHSLNGLWCCLFEHGGVTCLSPPPQQVHVGTSHQEQRVVGYVTCTHLHAIEGRVICSTTLSFCLLSFLSLHMHTWVY